MFFIFLMALSLAIDAFAVSVTSSLAVRAFRPKNALVMGLYFGGFQFFMPLAGWFLGRTVANYVTALGPYISFVLLAAIGGKMVWEALLGKQEEFAPQTLTPGRLFMLAVATSIDALAAGVSLAFLDAPVFWAAAVIGLVALVLSVTGGLIGGLLGKNFQKHAQIVGGIVLILLGAKFLAENFL